jgi:hypothetical protein
MHMDRRKFLGMIGLAGAAAIPASAGLALGAPMDTLGATADMGGEPTVTTLPDGSISIVGKIRYNQALRGFVVQALVPAGVHGQYLIANPNEQALTALAENGETVVVQGMQTEGALLLMLQTVNGRALGHGAPKLNTPPSRR